MTSVDKKILKGGYQTKESPFPRSHFNTELNKLETERKLPSKSRFECKRSKGEHVYVFVPPNDEPLMQTRTKAQYFANLFQKKEMTNKWTNLYSLSKGANVYQCQNCGKTDIRWNR